MGLYSYGSGCAAEFLSGVVGPGAARELAPLRIRERLDARRLISFEEYTRLLKESRRCLVPRRERRIEVEQWSEYLATPGRPDRLLVLTGVEDYHRRYTWR